ncbi:hypothetical protein E4U42_002081 [Claviceps africana]|uniref:Uncharacterized protein n=1 Tax=Claviceps africana TaxID=83212 RepID=A0A8K0JB57_9HYPO|nr:hypothetical protein E4U42_002081 [Claviceps africana]
MRFSTSTVLAAVSICAGQALALGPDDPMFCFDHRWEGQTGPVEECKKDPTKPHWDCGAFEANVDVAKGQGPDVYDFWSGFYPITLRITCKGEKDVDGYTNGQFRYCTPWANSYITARCPGSEPVFQYFVNAPPEPKQEPKPGQERGNYFL